MSQARALSLSDIFGGIDPDPSGPEIVCLSDLQIRQHDVASLAEDPIVPITTALGNVANCGDSLSRRSVLLKVVSLRAHVQNLERS